MSPSISYILHTDQLQVFALIAIYCKNKLFWRGLNAAWIYGHKAKYLEGSLILCLLE